MANLDRLRDFLVSFHEQQPSATAQAMNLFTDDEGSGPYSVFVNAVAMRCGEDARVLDIGCGDGSLVEKLVERLAPAHITGIDLANADIVTAKKRVPDADFIVNDFLQHPFPNNAYDCVAAHLVLMLMGRLEAVLDKIGRLLVPGGSLVFNVDDSVVQNDSFGMLIRTAMTGFELGADVRELAEAADRRLYDPAALTELLRLHGFEVADVRPYRLRATLDASGAWDVVSRTYQVGALDHEQASNARRSIDAAFEESQREIELPLKLVVATRTQG